MNDITDFITQCSKTAQPEPLTPLHSELTKEMVAMVAPFVPAGSRVLDLGCGSGVAFEYFAKAGFRKVWAITCALDYDCARQAARENNKERAFTVFSGDMHNLSWPDRNVGLVWARHILEHSPAPYFVICEAFKALNSGGIFYVEVPAPGTCCHHESNLNHYSVLGVRAWARLIERAGFEWVQVNDAPAVFERTVSTDCGPDTYFQLIARKP